VLAANRDEFFQRATAPARFWPESPALLAGRDLVAGSPTAHREAETAKAHRG